MKRLTACLLAVSALILTSCSTGGSSDKKLDSAINLLTLPTIDTGNGLVIDGEQIADADLYKAARSRTVVLYSASGKESEDLTIARFTKETGIKVELTRMATNKLAERVLSEQGAGQMKAEVIRVTDPRVADQFVDRGIYVPYRTPFHEQLERQEQSVGGDDQYVNCYFSVNSVGYNSALVTGDDIPTSWEDLTEDRWKGKVGVVSVEAGGTLVALANFERTVLGPAFLSDLAATEPRVFDTTAVETDALARGEIEVATMSFNNAFGAKLAGAPIELIVPTEGVSGSMNPLGLTANGLDNPAAQVFYNWTMSKEGQRFAAAQGFVPGREGLPPQKTGEYQLPSAGSDKFRLYGPNNFEKTADEDVAAWKRAFGFLG